MIFLVMINSNFQASRAQDSCSKESIVTVRVFALFKYLITRNMSTYEAMIRIRILIVSRFGIVTHPNKNVWLEKSPNRVLIFSSRCYTKSFSNTSVFEIHLTTCRMCAPHKLDVISHGYHLQYNSLNERIQLGLRKKL
jgi:hypothetical protein